MRTRHYIAIMASSLLVVLAFTVGLFEDPPGVRDATFSERLYYAAAAKLAHRGVRAYCSGIERDGFSVHVRHCEIASKLGIALVKDATVSIAGEKTWLPMFRIPTVAVSAARVTVARRNVSSSASEPTQIAKQEGRGMLALVPVRLDLGALVVKQLPSPVAVSFFGWPLADSPRGDVKVALAGAVANVRVSRDNNKHVTGRAVAYVAPSFARALLGKKKSKLDTAQGVVTVSADFDLGPDMLAAKAAAMIDTVCLEHPRFGEGRACDLGVRGAARFAMSKERLFVDAARVRIINNAAQASTVVSASGSLPFARGDAGDHRRDPASAEADDALTFQVDVPAQDVDQVLATIPRVWRTGLFGFELDGQFSAAFRLTFQGDDFTFDPSFRFDGVKVKNAPPGQDPRRLNGAVSWKMPFPYPHTVSLWPEAGYVALSRLPQVLVDAVRVSEDAAFYSHDGFDRSEIAKAIVDIKEGAGARGASTITQQLAKNLYFDGDRNLTRKIEEAICTAALEASVPKWRLLEIYLNVIEWGDGVFGVERAARRYFKKGATELSGTEAAFLAGIIPAPRKVDREMRATGYSAWADKRALRVTKFLCDLGKLDTETCVDAEVRSSLAAAAY